MKETRPLRVTLANSLARSQTLEYKIQAHDDSEKQREAAMRSMGATAQNPTHKEKKSNSIDMLHGPLLGKIVLFAIPLALSSILQQLFNSADAVVAGRLISSQALAAVGGVAPVTTLLIGLFVGLSIGSNVAIAIRIGHGRADLIQGAVQTTVIVTAISSVGLTIFGMASTGPILEAIGMPEEATKEAADYLRVYFAGITFYLVYNFGSAVLRAKGDTRRPLYALAAAVAANVVLNIVAVGVFNAGVVGIAIATDISNAIAAGIIVHFLLHEEENFRLNLGKIALDRKALKMILYIGLPSGLQSVVFSLSNVVIQAAINSFGSDATAGAAATMNYEYYTYFFTSAFSQAAVTFIGQNFAAGNLKRCDSIVGICMGAALVSTITLSALFVGLGNISLGVFTTEAAALGYGSIRMWHVELLECMPATYEVTAGAMRGMGWSVLPTVVVIIGACLLRIVYIAFMFPQINDFTALMDIYPATWVVTGVTMVALFFFARHRAYAGARKEKAAATSAH